MKKIISVLCVLAIMLLCGCGADNGSINVTNAPGVTNTQTVQASGVSFEIPNETKVFARPEELAPLKPLFESYITGNEILMFAVSAEFKGEPYIMGFLYKNKERTLPFSRVIGLKQNGENVAEAFVSDNYKPDANFEPENFLGFQDGMFYDTQLLETGGMLVVKTNEFASEDAAFHNIFLLSERGLADNRINITLNEPCELYQYKDKLLYNESYTWYEFTAADNNIVLNEITDFKPYKPEINADDLVITLSSFEPGKDIAINANGSALTKKNFKPGEDEEGDQALYISRMGFVIQAGTRIILLYAPGVKTACHISGDMDDSGFEYISLPGAEVLRAQEAGRYTVQLENGDIYQVIVTAE